MVEKNKRIKPLRIPQVLSENQVERLFNAVSPKDPYCDLIFLKCLYYLCLRISECLSLRKEDFDKEFSQVRIKGKARTDMAIPIPKEFRRELKKYVSQIKEDNLFDFNRTTGWKKVKEYAERAGLDKWVHPHTLRHSGATHLYKVEPDIKALQRFLRHRSIASTSIYAHVDLERVREFVDKGFSKI